MANKIVLKKSSVPAKVPLSTDLQVGELAVNLEDQKLYSKKADGTVVLVGTGVGGGGSGDVVGPASATDNAITRYDGTTGKLIQNSTVTLDDNGTLVNVNAISLDTTPTTPPTTAGTVYWDAGNGTPSVVLSADTELQLGQENIAKVYNGSGATIPNGAVVAVVGSQGQRPTVGLADADSESTSAGTLGIATESIANGVEGFVCTFGLVRGLNTNGFTEGAPIYLSQTAGQFTQTRPSAPAHTVFLGWVIKANASSGEIFVNISNGWELDELHNVLITSPTGGNLLAYDQTNQYWKNINLTDGTGISVTETTGGAITVTNTAPDQVVSITGAGTSVVTGTYPNFTVTSNDQYNGTVTSVGGTGTVNGITLTGTVTSSGNLTLGGTLSGVNLTTQVSGTLPIVNGGTGATTRQDAMDALAGAVTSGQYLRGNGTDVVMSAIQAADVPTLNQNTTGTAANVTGTVAIANGGTGATTAATALTNLGAYPATNPNGYTSNTGTVTSVGGTGSVNGITLSGSVTSTGNLTLGGTLSGVSLTSQVTGILPIANGGTGQTSGAAAFNALSPITSNGDLIIGNGANSATRLAIGANNTVLTSNGSTASWQAAPFGNLVYLQTKALSGSTTNYDFTGLSGYNDYLIVYEDLNWTTTGTVTLFFQIQIGGTTFLTSGYSGSAPKLASTYSSVSTGTTGIGALANVVTGGLYGYSYFLNMLGGDFMQFGCCYGASFSITFSSAKNTNTAAKTGIRLSISSLTGQSGNLHLYGVKYA